MQLKEYLQNIGQSQRFFAKKIGLSNQTIGGYCNHLRMPDKFAREKIEELTDGKVKKDEWKEINLKTKSSLTTSSTNNPFRDV